MPTPLLDRHREFLMAKLAEKLREQGRSVLRRKQYTEDAWSSRG
jgi:hypothetical protein